MKRSRLLYFFLTFTPFSLSLSFQNQAYKAFAKEVDNLQKVLKKKGAAAASDEFSNTVEVALDLWLSEIELPRARELQI